MRYRSGDEVFENDEVLLWGNPARVEFIVLDGASSEHRYYFDKFGRGVMFCGEKVGNYYCDEEALPNEEDIVFVRRSAPQRKQ